MPSRHAYLVLCHTCPPQINALTSLLANDYADVFVHLDARFASLLHELTPLTAKPGVQICSSYPIVWGGFAMIKATLELLRQAVHTHDYAYIHLLSGQCLPLRPMHELQAHFEQSSKPLELQYMDCAPFPVPGLFMGGLERFLVAYPPEYLGRFRGAKAQRIHDYKLSVMADATRQRDISALPPLHHGSQWFSITGAFAQYILDYCRRNRTFTHFFEQSLIPDEMFFQTILMDSPFATSFTRQTARFMDWKRGGPYVLRENDLPEVLASGCMFARKFDMNIDEGAVTRLVTMLGTNKA